MLKYGDIKNISNGTSKTLFPKNLVYRENQVTPTTSNSLISISNTDTKFNLINTNIIQKNTTDTISIIDPTLNETYANPLIIYNGLEKKYIAKMQIVGGTGTLSYIFKNVLNSVQEQITFSGKIISRDANNNSASFVFVGYTKYKDINNTNYLEFIVDNLYSSDLINWSLNAFYITNTDMILVIQSKQTTTTNWVASIETISI